MLKPSIKDLVERKGNRYKLCIATSKRARAIIEGEEPMIVPSVYKPVSIAVEELDADKYEIIDPAEEE